jgi:hypothetical protein
MSGESQAGDERDPDTKKNNAASGSPKGPAPSGQPASTSAQGGADGGNRMGKEKKKLEELVSLAWKGLLFLGGIFLLIFFVQVGFFPSFKLEDLTATLAAVSLIGLSLLAIFAGSFVLPALTLHDSFERLKSAKCVVLMSALAGGLPVWAISLSLLFYRTVQWWVGLLVALVALLFIFLAYQIHRPERAKPIKADSAGKVCDEETKRKCFIARCRTNTPDDGVSNDSDNPLIEVISVAAVFFFAQLVATYYFVLMYRPTDQDLGKQVIELFAWPAVCFVANVALLHNPNKTDEKNWWKTLAATAGVLLLMFMSVTGASSLMSGGIARKLALGDIPSTVVMLSKQGCEIAEVSSRSAMTCQQVKADGSGVVCPVTIVSRMGSEVVLQPENSNFEVVMKSTEVLGWARTAPPAFANSASGASAASGATVASGATGSDAKQEGSKKTLSLDCSAAPTQANTTPAAPASPPSSASAPAVASSSASVLSAVRLAEIKTTAQNTIVRTMTTHRHSAVSSRVAPAATNIFYDNHGEVTVNNIGGTRGMTVSHAAPSTAMVSTSSQAPANVSR